MYSPEQNLKTKGNITNIHISSLLTINLKSCLLMHLFIFKPEISKPSHQPFLIQVQNVCNIALHTSSVKLRFITYGITFTFSHLANAFIQSNLERV